MSPSRTSKAVLAGLAVAYAGLVVALSANPGPRAWAFHLPGFLPPPTRTLVLALILGGAALLVWDFTRTSPAPSRRKAPRRKGASLPRWSGWLLLPLWVLLLWRLAARTHFLGDGTVWLRSIQSGHLSPFSEPLAAATWSGFGHLLRALGIPIDAVTAGLLPVLCGILAAALSWGLAAEIAPRASRETAFALLLTAGFAQLYFGYIESYPLSSVAILAYLWLGARCLRGAMPPIWPALALGIAVPFHLACAYLAPSLVYLLFVREPSWLRRAALAVGSLAVAALTLIVLGYAPANWSDAFRVAARAVEPGHGPAALAKPYGAFSLDHAWDLLNAIALAMPVPAMLLAGAAAGRMRERSSITWFLVAAALPGLLLAAALVLQVAPAQDWDLTSILLIPLAVLGVHAGLSGTADRSARAAGLVTLGAGALLAFVLVNADERGGTRRYETLVGPGSKITAYGRAYGNELLATYDADRRDFASAVVHAQRAVDAEPTNPRYWTKKGAALYELKRYDEAIATLREAIRRGPWRDDAWYDLGNTLVQTHAFAEAAGAFREAIRLGKPQPDYFHNLGVALYYEGKADSARALWEDVVKRWPDYPLSRRSLARHFGEGSAQ